MTKTGYRSYFTSPEEIDACGGPLAFAGAWLDEAARDPARIDCYAAARQLSLF